MDRSTCDCGMPILRASDDLGCLECGEPCCPVCAYVLESVVYCAFCAVDLLDVVPDPARMAADATSEPRGVFAGGARDGVASAWRVI
jgi:hypothetical protein